MEKQKQALIKTCVKTCGETAFGKGLKYQEQKRISQLDWSEEDRTLRAKVKGSGRHNYFVSIEFTEEYTSFAGDCTCPVRYDCKHCVATVLQWLEEPEQGWKAIFGPQFESPIEHWRDFLSRLDQEFDAHEDPEARADIYYLLKPDLSSETETIHVTPARGLKKRAGEKIQAISFNRSTFDFQFAGNIPNTDKQILGLIDAYDNMRKDRDDTDDISLPLVGEEGALLLQKILLTGNCFWAELDTPLSSGPEYELDTEWVEDENGHFKLKLTTKSLSELIICACEPPWYIDPRRHLAGVIKTNLSGKILNEIQIMPPIPAEQAQQVSQLIWANHQRAPLPLPTQIQIETINEAPQPVLQLITKINETTRNKTYIAQLKMRYQNLRLPHISIDPRLEINLIDEDKNLHILRDINFENQAIETLLAMDFRQQEVPKNTIATQLQFERPNENQIDQEKDWTSFIENEARELQALGWLVERDNAFSPSYKQVSSVSVSAHSQEENQWFDIAVDIEIDGKKVSLISLLSKWASKSWANNGGHGMIKLPNDALVIPTENGGFIEIDAQIVKPIIETLIEINADDRPYNLSTLRYSKHNAPMLLALRDKLQANEEIKLQWEIPDFLMSLAERMRDFRGIQAVDLPENLDISVRDYQIEGFHWLQFLREYGFGGILADDMGLGKTLQALLHILKEKQSDRMQYPVLVVAPTSLMSNWRREVQKFTPSLSVLTLHGNQRAELFDQIDHHDIILTTYPLMARDIDIHREKTYYMTLLDEAQFIKNPKTKTARALCEVKSEHRVCISGTPIENHLGELWSQINFLMPGFLSNDKTFNHLFRKPIEEQLNQARSRQLAERVSPFVLRRDKEQVAQELPAKTEILQTVTLEAEQANLYESIRASMEQRVREALRGHGLARSHITILDALLKLRQACCDPRLVKLASAKGVEQSAKLNSLTTMLPELLAEGRRVLIFSQFTSMLDLIEDELKKDEVRYVKLTGQTRNREEVIDRFQNGEVDVFLISLKAGGVGLNLTSADTVFIYDPWWNPAVENQAIDRAHRIGQEKKVFVYRMIAENTVEEKILAMQARKKALADTVVGNDDSVITKMNSNEILALFSADT